MRVRYVERRRLKGGDAFYYCPPADAIAAGILENCPLGTDEAQAHAKAQAYNQVLDAWRAGDRAGGYVPGSIGWLIAEYKRSSWYRSRKPKTRQGYDADLARIEHYRFPSGGELGRMPAAAIGPAHADAIYEALKPRGLRTANGVMVMGSRLWNYGKRYHRLTHGIDENPFWRMSLEKPARRTVRWEMEQVDRFVAEADRIGAWGIGTAALICYLFNQRVTDAITLPLSAWDGAALLIRQSKKHGELVWVPALPEFIRRMADRPQHAAVQIVIDERTGRPFDQYGFSHRAADIRAAAGLPKHLQVRDLKRTGATETRRAGATTHELQATTGNSLETIQIYALPTAPEAAAAIRKRSRYRTKLRQESKRASERESK